jgi:hypothetical protein
LSEAGLDRPSLRDRLLVGPRRAWQATPTVLRPTVGVMYWTGVAVLMRLVVGLISRALSEEREFRFDTVAFRSIALSAFLSALAFGIVRATIRAGRLTPWVLGQVVSWVFWAVFFGLTPAAVRPTATPRSPVEFAVASTGFGIVVGLLFWIAAKRRGAA